MNPLFFGAVKTSAPAECGSWIVDESPRRDNLAVPRYRTIYRAEGGRALTSPDGRSCAHPVWMSKRCRTGSSAPTAWASTSPRPLVSRALGEGLAVISLAAHGLPCASCSAPCSRPGDDGRPLVNARLNAPKVRVSRPRYRPPPPPTASPRDSTARRPRVTVLAAVRRPPHLADQLEHHRGARALQHEEGSRSSCGGRSPTCR